MCVLHIWMCVYIFFLMMKLIPVLLLSVFDVTFGTDNFETNFSPGNPNLCSKTYVFSYV